MTQTKNVIHGASLAASVAMALAACASEPPPVATTTATAAPGGTVQCKESNSCKGQATCNGVAGGEKHGCKGSNKCAGNLRELSKAECDAIKGTAVAAK